MRLSFSKSKNATSLYVIKDVVENNKRTTKVVEKLGTLDDLEKKLNGKDPVEWEKNMFRILMKRIPFYPTNLLCPWVT